MSSRAAITLFLTVCCGLSWGLLAIFHLVGGTSGSAAFYSNVVLAYGLGPLAGALAVQWRRREKAFALFGGDPFPNRWYLLAWLLPPLLAVVAMFLGALAPGAELTFDLLHKLDSMRAQLSPEEYEQGRQNLATVPPLLFFLANLMPALMYGATITAAVAAAEEIGWRVILLGDVARLGFWPAALLLGVIRGAWAVPLALDGFPHAQHPQEGALVVVGLSVLTSILSTFLRLRGGTVLPSALFVGGLNASANVSTLFIIGGTDLTCGLAGLPGLFVLAVAVVVVVVPRARSANDALRVLVLKAVVSLPPRAPSA